MAEQNDKERRKNTTEFKVNNNQGQEARGEFCKMHTKERQRERGGWLTDCTEGRREIQGAFQPNFPLVISLLICIIEQKYFAYL